MGTGKTPGQEIPAATTRRRGSTRVPTWRPTSGSIRRGQLVGDAASDSKDEVLVRECDMAVLDEVRKVWAFYRDRRPDSYDALTAP